MRIQPALVFWLQRSHLAAHVAGSALKPGLRVLLEQSEGKAGESSQSMLVAQLMLCLGFLVFLLYPAVITVFRGV